MSTVQWSRAMTVMMRRTWGKGTVSHPWNTRRIMTKTDPGRNGLQCVLDSSSRSRRHLDVSVHMSLVRPTSENERYGSLHRYAKNRAFESNLEMSYGNTSDSGHGGGRYSWSPMYPSRLKRWRGAKPVIDQSNKEGRVAIIHSSCDCSTYSLR